MTKTERDESPTVGGQSLENEEQNRKRRSLRSAQCDLKVIVGQDRAGDNQDENMEVNWHFSQTLAAQSRYIDTLLSTSIGTKNDSNVSEDHTEIVIDDITPKQWKRMIRFINNPLAFESITIDDAMELAPIYDKYEFPLGIQICDAVLFEKALCASSVPIDQRVQAIALAQDINLKKTFHWGRSWLKTLFAEALDAVEVAKFPLTAVQINLLAPALIRDGELRDLSDVFGTDNKIDDNMIMEHLNASKEDISFNLISVINDHFHSDDVVDLTSPLFPGFLLAKMEIACASRSAQKHFRRINLEFNDRNHPADGNYTYQGNRSYSNTNDEAYKLKRCPRKRHWQFCHNNQILATCRNSRFSPIPPESGWVATAGVNLKMTRLNWQPFYY